MDKLEAHFPTFAVLRLAVPDPDLRKKYEEVIQKHNEKLFADSFPNSGFDLLVASTTNVSSHGEANFVSMGVKCEMLFMNRHPCGYFMFPRSSMSKTPLMLANHTGIIDAGYRGFIAGAFRSMDTNPPYRYMLEANTRIVQLCHPSLCPLYVVLIDEADLTRSIRGEGGFGSTGK